MEIDLSSISVVRGFFIEAPPDILIVQEDPEVVLVQVLVNDLKKKRTFGHSMNPEG